MTLSDGTQYPSLFVGTVGSVTVVLPGLVVFSSGVSGAASVDASSGTVTLVDNFGLLVMA